MLVGGGRDRNPHRRGALCVALLYIWWKCKKGLPTVDLIRVVDKR